MHNIGYLVPEYKKDACHLRADYIAMELAAINIPASKIFLRKQKVAGEVYSPQLSPEPGVRWGFHVCKPC